MRLYLDDDSVNRVLIVHLRQAGHDVQIPADLGLMGDADPVHLLHAIRDNRVFLSHNHDDFEDLHDLVIGSGGSHPGILIVRRDRLRKRNMSHAQIVAAIARLVASGAAIPATFTVLNHWR